MIMLILCANTEVLSAKRGGFYHVALVRMLERTFFVTSPSSCH